MFRGPWVCEVQGWAGKGGSAASSVLGRSTLRIIFGHRTTNMDCSIFFNRVSHLVPRALTIPVNSSVPHVAGDWRQLSLRHLQLYIEVLQELAQRTVLEGWLLPDELTELRRGPLPACFPTQD